ncbi:tRNA (guanosine(37)-N1)-methyltransferase TrmD [Ahniella affigens]|uniref:tRNA (guanine-N(1)-)-methyltransferase n=1 Tax=Ahniella affigens TaxID=2021234 RepID=A0A2P1PMW6_9GAMM|nr:tRNA (guanosine(37)-N1)-methyltransferase TrmD [Ahniella affigens]AVP96179.1 tRNA (guanosine(37)-N1)-methyltransferase TrmD [Ahniella affigens]
MRIDVITLFPEFILEAAKVGVVGRAMERKLLDVQAHNPREDAEGVHRKVDDRPFGGGPGMVMMVEPIRRCIQRIRALADPAPVIYLSPQGPRLTQNKVEQLAKTPRFILLCGRYEGIDERLFERDIDEELSIGDYVLSGGELAAAVVIDAVGRLQEGALGDAESAAQDSFGNGLLDCPHYTRPPVDGYGDAVPDVLMSGNHREIAKWRLKQSLGRTWLRRPDLLQSRVLTPAEQKLLDEFRREYTSAP